MLRFKREGKKQHGSKSFVDILSARIIKEFVVFVLPSKELKKYTVRISLRVTIIHGNNGIYWRKKIVFVFWTVTWSSCSVV